MKKEKLELIENEMSSNIIDAIFGFHARCKNTGELEAVCGSILSPA